MAVLSPTADFICEICLNNYDTVGRKPYSLVPCGHTFCLHCMNQITSNLCPTCRSPFEGRIPNWEITKRLDSTIQNRTSLPNAPPAPQVVVSNGSPVPATNLIRSMDTGAAAGQEPTCMEDFLNTSTKRKFAVFYNTFLIFVALIYPVALTWVGFEHSSQCFLDSMIPLWMIVYGLFGTLMCFLWYFLLQYLMIRPKERRSKIALSILTLSTGLVTFFELAWFFVGTVWVFRAYSRVSYDLRSYNEPANYCHPDLFRFAFGTLVAQCCLFGIFICISPCLMCCLPWRKLNQI